MVLWTRRRVFLIDIAIKIKNRDDFRFYLFFPDVLLTSMPSFHVSERIFTRHPVFIDSASTRIASLEYLQKRISKSVPSYLGRSFEPTK
jgi:hypothetical protein